MHGMILVAKDQDSERESLAELLRGEAYEVHEAVDVNCAKTLIRELDLDVINVRILAASNRDLNAEVEASAFAKIFIIG